MRGFFLQDLKRSFLNKGFFAGLLAVTWLLADAVFQAPLDRTRSSYFILANVEAASGFGPFAAVFPSLAYASAFCEEYNSGYLKMIFSRISSKKFGMIRIITVALSGGVMVAVPILVSCGMAYYFGIPGIPGGSDEGMLDGTMMRSYIENYGDWYVFAWKVILGLLFGCMWALAGLAFAVWIPNKYVSLIAPFVLYETMWIVFYKIPLLNPIWLRRGDAIDSYPLSGFMECVYILLAAIVVMMGVKRRFRNG